METKRLYRNPQGRIIGGVCTGFADYFDIDVTVIRLIFVILAFAGGVGILLYLIFLIATQEKPYDFSQFQNQNSSTMENQQTNPETNPGNNPGNPQDPYNHKRYNRTRGNLIGGLVLITLGALFLADEFIPHISFSDLWPIILVVIGIGLLINSVTGKRRNY